VNRSGAIRSGLLDAVGVNATATASSTVGRQQRDEAFEGQKIQSENIIASDDLHEQALRTRELRAAKIALNVAQDTWLLLHGLFNTFAGD